jgi:hypothetical protein
MSPETTETQYWAVLGGRDGGPRTLVRRRPTPERAVEEILEADGRWHTTGVLALHRLNMYEHELRPISADEALAYEKAWGS